jgi:hypothetical protein
LSAASVPFCLVCWRDTMDGEFCDESEFKLPVPKEEVELSGCAAMPCCNPRRPLHRFVAMLFLCMLGFGK